MEYNKIKEEMNKRRLMPKKETWNNLEKQLNQSTSKPNISIRFTVAASVVAILIFSSIVFFVFKTQESLPSIAKQQKDPIAVPTESNVRVQPNKSRKDFKENEENTYPLTAKINNKTRAKSNKLSNEKASPIVYKTSNKQKNKQRNSLIQAAVKNESKTSNKNIALALVPDKVENKLENIEKPVTPIVQDEVADLLANAHAAIKKSHPKAMPTKTDPNALLRDAEWDARVKQETKLAGWINKNLKTFAKEKLSPKNASL